MKFKTELAGFQKILQKTQPAIPRKSTLPVLEHLNFSLEEGKLKIIATDQDITIMSHINVEEAEDGKILVPGRKLNDIVRNYQPTGHIEFFADPETFDIDLNIQKGKYKLKGMDPDEYLSLPELFESEKPEMPTGEPQESDDSPKALFKADEIKWLSDKTFFAVSSDEFRPAMNGVLFQFRESFMNGVATDSFKLVRATVRKDKPEFPKDVDLVIPSRSVDILRKADEDVLMSVIERDGRITHARFDIGETVFITKIIDEKFPPYENVIPTNNDLILKVDQARLLDSIKRVAIVTSTISNQIKLVAVENLLTLIGENEEMGDQGNEAIECNYSGANLEIGFNVRYLQEIIQNIADETEKNTIKLMFSEPAKPAIIKPDTEEDNLLMLIMPVRI